MSYAKDLQKLLNGLKDWIYKQTTARLYMAIELWPIASEEPNHRFCSSWLRKIRIWSMTARFPNFVLSLPLATQDPEKAKCASQINHTRCPVSS